MTQHINNGPFYFLIALGLGLIYLYLWSYLKPKVKSDHPKVGKVSKRKLNDLLDFDEADLYK